ncbi:hypothetical protein [Litoribacter ruber]|nr:hypothetical protein [Litoribacter ruber]
MVKVLGTWYIELGTTVSMKYEKVYVSVTGCNDECRMMNDE